MTLSRWMWVVIAAAGVFGALAAGQEKQEPSAEEPPSAEVPQKAFVLMETSKGEILLELDGAKAPKTVANFLQYVEDGHYEGTIFHRVINGFMIQGGGFTPEMEEKPTRDPIVNEGGNGLKNDRGTIAMARTNDPDSATSQFYINVVNNDMLNRNPESPGYAVFGRVIDGLDVVDEIRLVQTTTRSGHRDVPAEPVVIERVARLSAEEVEKMMAENTVRVTMQTSMGDIVLQLDKEKAPISTANFVEYARKGHYDGTIFHRVIGNFMIQGGGFTTDMRQKPTDDPIKNEWENGLRNVRGAIAMARTSDPDSATAQFFINVVDNPGLDEGGSRTGGAGYAVFGRVVEGLDVVDKIKQVKTTSRAGHQNVPAEPVVIEKVVVEGGEG